MLLVKAGMTRCELHNLPETAILSFMQGFESSSLGQPYVPNAGRPFPVFEHHRDYPPVAKDWTAAIDAAAALPLRSLVQRSKALPERHRNRASTCNELSEYIG